MMNWDSYIRSDCTNLHISIATLETQEIWIKYPIFMKITQSVSSFVKSLKSAGTGVFIINKSHLHLANWVLIR